MVQFSLTIQLEVAKVKNENLSESASEPFSLGLRKSRILTSIKCAEGANRMAYHSRSLGELDVSHRRVSVHLYLANAISGQLTNFTMIEAKKTIGRVVLGEM